MPPSPLDLSSRQTRSRAEFPWRWGLKFAFAAGVAYYVATRAPLEGILDVLLRVDLGYLLLAMSVVPLTAWVIAARQKVLTDWQGLSLTVRQIMSINLVTRYYDLMLPAYVSGVAIRWPRMAQRDDKPAEALASIVFNRYAEILTAVVLGLVFWFLGRPAGLDSLWISVGFPLLLCVLVVVQMLLFNAVVARWWCRVLHEGWLRRLPVGLRTRTASLAQAIGEFQHLPARSLLWVALLSLVRGLTLVLAFVFMAWALHLDLSFAAAGWIRATLKLAAVVPLSFMGVGIREVGVIILLQFYDISPADAVALSALLVGRNLAKALLGGVLEARTVFLHRCGAVGGVG